MRVLTSLTCLMALATSFVLAAAQREEASRAKEAAVREVVRQYVEARERRDADGIRRLFTADADQLTSGGEWRKGREQIVSGTLASSVGNPGARTIAVESVRLPAPGVAIADGRYEIGGAAGAAPRRMWTTFVLAEQPDGWRIAAIRNMLPAR